jgi:hypothetical protein
MDTLGERVACVEAANEIGAYIYGLDASGYTPIEVMVGMSMVMNRFIEDLQEANGGVKFMEFQNLRAANILFQGLVVERLVAPVKT